jgi:hypothetical protein
VRYFTQFERRVKQNYNEKGKKFGAARRQVRKRGEKVEIN